jgi:hypothetical protein
MLHEGGAVNAVFFLARAGTLETLPYSIFGL